MHRQQWLAYPIPSGVSPTGIAEAPASSVIAAPPLRPPGDPISQRLPWGHRPPVGCPASPLAAVLQGGGGANGSAYALVPMSPSITDNKPSRERDEAGAGEGRVKQTVRADSSFTSSMDTRTDVLFCVSGKSGCCTCGVANGGRNF